MEYLKYVSFIYLIAAAFFIYDGITNLQAGDNAVISFVLAGLAVFMFFFRRRYYNKFNDRNNKNM